MMQFDLYKWRHQRTLAKHLLIGPNCVRFLEATNKIVYLIINADVVM